MFYVPVKVEKETFKGTTLATEKVQFCTVFNFTV